MHCVNFRKNWPLYYGIILHNFKEKLTDWGKNQISEDGLYSFSVIASAMMCLTSDIQVATFVLRNLPRIVQGFFH